MKKSKFTDSQILAMLKQNEGGAKVADLNRPGFVGDSIS
jgi:hypothetical protein